MHRTCGEEKAVCIRIVKVKGFPHPEDKAAVVYCGRRAFGWPPHPLANPFKPDNLHGTEHVLQQYKSWLLARPDLLKQLDTLWCDTEQGRRPLGCWCVNAAADDGSPVVCHAQILAGLLNDRFVKQLLRPSEKVKRERNK